MKEENFKLSKKMADAAASEIKVILGLVIYLVIFTSFVSYIETPLRISDLGPYTGGGETLLAYALLLGSYGAFVAICMIAPFAVTAIFHIIIALIAKRREKRR